MSVEKLAQIPEERVADLKATVGDEETSREDFTAIEELVCAAVFSPLRRDLAVQALTGFMGTPVQIYVEETAKQIITYVTFNHHREVFFQVGTYSITNPPAETVPTDEELVALRSWARLAPDQYPDEA